MDTYSEKRDIFVAKVHRSSDGVADSMTPTVVVSLYMSNEKLWNAKC